MLEVAPIEPIFLRPSWTYSPGAIPQWVPDENPHLFAAELRPVFEAANVFLDHDSMNDCIWADCKFLYWTV